MAGPAIDSPAPSRSRKLLRAMGLRCPQCGAGGLLIGWRLAHACPRCGLRIERGEHDHFLGSYTLNLFVGLTAATASAVAGVWLADRFPPWATVLVAAVVIVALAIGFYPWSKLLWLAIDLMFRPATERDYEPR